MNSLDIIMVGLVGFLVMRGFFRGLLRELGSIAGLVLGFFLANNFYDVVGSRITRYIGHPDLAAAVAWIGIYLAVVLLALLAVSAMKTLFMSGAVKGLDRVLGALFALVKGGLLCTILLLVLTAFLPPSSPTLNNSRIAPLLHGASARLTALIPADMDRKFREKSAAIANFSGKDFINKARESIGNDAIDAIKNK